ncbi:MAG: ATP-binding protein [Planctomycetota bacterium]
MQTPPSLHALALTERGPLGALVLQVGADARHADFTRVRFVNRRFARMLGLSTTDLRGELLTNFIPEARREHFVDVVATGLATGAWPSTAVYELFRHHDDRTVLLRLHIAADDFLAGADGVPRELLMFAEPASASESELDLVAQRTREMQRLALELKTTTASLQGVVTTLAGPVSNYLGGASPLARALTESLAADNDEMHARLAAQLLDAIEAARHLLDGLIAQRQIQTGQRRLNPLLLDLEDTLQEAAMAERALMLAKQLVVEVQAPDETVTFRADPKAIHTVLLNLLSNARKFTASGGRVRISGSQAGQSVVIRVEDTGLGIPSDTVPRLFDLSRPTTTPGTDGETGSGFGLLLAQEIVAAHGGVLLVESTPGRGSVFTVRMPMHPSSDTDRLLAGPSMG